MNAHKLISALIFTLTSFLRRFTALLSKTTRFPLLVKTGELLLALYFRHCGLSPSTISLNASTSVHIWSSTSHRHHNSKTNLILLHGFGGDSRWQFSSQIRTLSSQFNLFVPDLLFFGKSFSLSPDRTVQHQAKCLMDAIRIGFGLRKCSIYSISYGGWVGYWMAEMYPDVVEKVVIVSSGVGFSEEQRKVHLNKLETPVEDLLIPEGPSHMRALWNTWKWRNGFVFQGERFEGNRMQFVCGLHAEYQRIWAARISAQFKPKSEVHVRWIPPLRSWIRLNSDGSVRDGFASAGGVFRDADARWVGGFVHNIGRCSVPMAELWGIISGLRFAWESGFRKVCVETDSQLVVLLIRKPVASCHPLASLLALARSFICRDWVIQFRHIFREANRVADALATLAFGFPLGASFLENPPDSVCNVLCDDARGVSHSRLAIL